MATDTTVEASGQDAHLRRISEAHQNLREILYKLRRSSFPADLAYMRDDDPNETLLELLSATMDYYEQIAPMRRQIVSQSERTVDLGDGESQTTNYWVQDVYTAEVPVERKTDQNLSAGERDRLKHVRAMGNNHQQLQQTTQTPEPELEEVPISLESLPEWQGWVRRHDHERTLPQVGRLVERQRYRLVLPVAGAAKVFNQLNRCLRVLDLLADVQELEVWGYETVEASNGSQ